MNRNEVLDILNFRHACKEFDSTKKISSEDLEVIIEGGRLAPSSVGIEPWHFIVVENKNLILLLQSLNYLKEKNNNFQLLVAGDGNLKDQMVNYCTENNLNDNIEFLGNIDCMENFYNAIDVLVLPSFTEGVPLVVLEAAGRGKMIIMTENSGINEILDDNTDYLSINPYDKNDLIKVLNSVLENHNIIKEYSTNSFKKINKYIKENNFEKELKNIL